MKAEEKIVYSIIKDINRRKGLWEAWDRIDGRVQEEITEIWMGIVEELMIEFVKEYHEEQKDLLDDFYIFLQTHVVSVHGDVRQEVIDTYLKQLNP